MRKLLLILLAIGVLSGCSQQDKNIPVDTIKGKMTRGVAIESPVTIDLKTDKSAAERFGISIDKIEEGFVYTNDGRSEKADEIIVVKAKDKRNVMDIERALEAEITSLSSTWEGTDKDEYDKIQKHILKSKGSYVMLAIADDNKKAEQIFNESLE